MVIAVASRNDKQPKVEAEGDKIQKLYANGMKDCDLQNVKKKKSEHKVRPDEGGLTATVEVPPG